MLYYLRKTLILIILLFLSLPSYPQEKNSTAINPSCLDYFRKTAPQRKNAIDQEYKNTGAKYFFFNLINTEVYAATIDRGKERKILRQKWKEMLGLDIFYPYFEAKKVEKWVKEKASVNIFKLKGKPQFDDNQIKYIFNIKF